MKKVNHKRTRSRVTGKKTTGGTMPIKSVTRARRASIDKKVAAPSSRADAADALIDFPQEGELVLQGHYAVRISAEPGMDVEISSDEKEWSPTRPSVGFHWFDWTAVAPGRTVLSLRVKVGKGRWKKVSERECIVVESSGN